MIQVWCTPEVTNVSLTALGGNFARSAPIEVFLSALFVHYRFHVFS